MPVIYLKHPRHGTKVACSEDEAKYDQGNGWTRYTLDRQEAPDPPPADNNVTQIEPARRRGRPPKAA